jgi:DNA-binding LytR/AlgR family response regulator
MKRLEVTSDGEIYYIKIETILYLKAEGSYCWIKLASNKIIVIGKDLKYVMAKLQHINYLRQIHRSWVVNVNFIIKITTLSSEWGLKVQLENDEQIPLAASQCEVLIAFMDMFSQQK